MWVSGLHRIRGAFVVWADELRCSMEGIPAYSEGDSQSMLVVATA